MIDLGIFFRMVKRKVVHAVQGQDAGRRLGKVKRRILFVVEPQLLVVLGKPKGEQQQLDVGIETMKLVQFQPQNKSKISFLHGLSPELGTFGTFLNLFNNKI